ncbi:efflux RND transporter periplasmic adaptor subunit [Pendulispora brunnea]|uniref:Efflux RND transporter periplasmic adaptor subunit n=1 Tax=Pendulispora brunnea TaxID=2905690 RepID=A0ABZ2KFM0_9BACT
MKKIRKVVTIVIAIALLSGLAFGSWRYHEAHKEPPVVYKTAKAEKRNIVGRVTASGTLAATVTVQVGTQVSGRIKELYADFNSPVKKGQLVAKIDPLLFEAAVEQANANYLSAQADLNRAKATAMDADRQYVRAKALHESELASQKDLETAETTAQVARAAVGVSEAGLAQARAQLNQAKVNLSYTSIISPIDGTVISRSVDVGQTVAASLQAPVIFTIAEDLRKMKVDTNVAESDVGGLEPNMDVFFTVDAYPGQRFKGKIGQIRNAAQTVQNVVTYDAVIEVDNTDLKLRPGMTANTTIVYAQRNDALAVPNAALRFRPPSVDGDGAADAGSASADAPVSAAAANPNGPPVPRRTRQARGTKQEGAHGERKTLWVLRNGNAVPVRVQIGLSDGTYTEIVGGELQEGDQPIIDATLTGKNAMPSTPSTSSLPRGGGRLF